MTHTVSERFPMSISAQRAYTTSIVEVLQLPAAGRRRSAQRLPRARSREGRQQTAIPPSAPGPSVSTASQHQGSPTYRPTAAPIFLPDAIGPAARGHL